MENVNPFTAIQTNADSSAIRSGVLLLYSEPVQFITFSELLQGRLDVNFCSTMDSALEELYSGYIADVVVADERNGGWELLQYMRKSDFFRSLPFIVLVAEIDEDTIRKAQSLRASDVFPQNLGKGDLLTRLQYFGGRRKAVALRAARRVAKLQTRIPAWKRTLDLVVVGTAVLLLLPVYLLVSLLIRLDSPGPVFYKSERVGRGYRIFGLYKFRTMRVNADKLIKDMGALNAYKKSEDVTDSGESIELCQECKAMGLSQCEQMLFLDGMQICEKVYRKQKENDVAFMKFRNDPRITRIGAFLRNTSLDELPQFLNIIKGDMSLVGNRPLPMYEAEKLTTDDKILRFTAPAGLTGLWQVTKRGKKDMSEEERIALDVEYAQNFSFWMDLKIVLKTFPALFQSENV